MKKPKSEPQAKAPQPKQRDDLDLDAQIVKDLEPKASSAEDVRGGTTKPTQRP